MISGYILLQLLQQIQIWPFPRKTIALKRLLLIVYFPAQRPPAGKRNILVNPHKKQKPIICWGDRKLFSESQKQQAVRREESGMFLELEEDAWEEDGTILMPLQNSSEDTEGSSFQSPWRWLS